MSYGLRLVGVLGLQTIVETITCEHLAYAMARTDLIVVLPTTISEAEMTTDRCGPPHPEVCACMTATEGAEIEAQTVIMGAVEPDRDRLRTEADPTETTVQGQWILTMKQHYQLPDAHLVAPPMFRLSWPKRSIGPSSDTFNKHFGIEIFDVRCSSFLVFPWLPSSKDRFSRAYRQWLRSSGGLKSQERYLFKSSIGVKG